MCNFRPFNAHIQIFSYVFLNFPQQILTFSQNSYSVIGANCAVEIALSGRQCSLLCLFAPFPHGYTVSRGVPDNCTFEITLSRAITLTLLLVCAFSPKVQSIFWGPQFAPQNDRVLRTERNRFKNDQSVYVEFKTNRINIIQY